MHPHFPRDSTIPLKSTNNKRLQSVSVITINSKCDTTRYMFYRYNITRDGGTQIESNLSRVKSKYLRLFLLHRLVQ